MTVAGSESKGPACCSFSIVGGLRAARAYGCGRSGAPLRPPRARKDASSFGRREVTSSTVSPWERRLGPLSFIHNVVFGARLPHPHQVAEVSRGQDRDAVTTGDRGRRSIGEATASVARRRACSVSSSRRSASGHRRPTRRPVSTERWVSARETHCCSRPKAPATRRSAARLLRSRRGSDLRAGRARRVTVVGQQGSRDRDGPAWLLRPVTSGPLAARDATAPPAKGQ